jgi:hypothetical protein
VTETKAAAYRRVAESFNEQICDVVCPNEHRELGERVWVALLAEGSLWAKTWITFRCLDAGYAP